MLVSLIAAVARNGVIGRAGGLPWRLKDDLAYFKRVTMGKPVVMGRKTFESIGKPLPGRRNVVISRHPATLPAGVDAVAGIPEALRLLEGTEEVMVIGGGEIYALALPLAGRLYLTEIDADVDGDVSFPPRDEAAWGCSSREEHGEGEWRYAWAIYERIKGQRDEGTEGRRKGR